MALNTLVDSFLPQSEKVWDCVSAMSNAEITAIGYKLHHC